GRGVFTGIQAPSHRRTLEAAQLAAAALTPTGVYLASLTDHPPLQNSRVEVATLQEVFGHVAIIADPAILRGRRYGNVVLLGSQQPIPHTDLQRRLRRLPLPVRLVTGADLIAFAGTHHPRRDPQPATGPQQ